MDTGSIPVAASTNICNRPGDQFLQMTAVVPGSKRYSEGDGGTPNGRAEFRCATESDCEQREAHDDGDRDEPADAAKPEIPA